MQISCWLIRLQRIYNFWLFHAIILSVLDVLYALICYSILFFGLIYEPRAQCQFLFFPCFWASQKRNTERSPNGIKLHDDFSWTRRHPGDLESKPEEPRGGGKGGGRAPNLVGPSRVSWPNSFAHIYSYTPKPSGEPWKHFSTAATFCTHEIPYRGLFRHPARGGFDHGGLLHQIYYPSDEAWVVYHGPTGP